MPRLVKMYIRHVLIGFAVAALFVAMLLWFNVMNLAHLIASSDAGVLAVIVLWFAHGIVFAGVQFAIAVMALAERPKSGGGKPERGAQPIAVPVPVKDDRAKRG